MLPMALCWAPNRLFYDVHRFKDPLKNWLGFNLRGPCYNAIESLYSISCTMSVKQSHLHRLGIILVRDVFYQALVWSHILLCRSVFKTISYVNDRPLMSCFSLAQLSPLFLVLLLTFVEKFRLINKPSLCNLWTNDERAKEVLLSLLAIYA
jgi:hypothetical protein